MSKLLNVKKTSKFELADKWGVFPTHLMGKECYIRCNAKGDVNWAKAPVYSSKELIERDNVKIIS